MKALLIVLFIIFCSFAYEYYRIKPLIVHTQHLIRTAHPFERAIGTVSILVVGDSTGVGVGASTSTASVPGRLSELLDASVENHAVSGARVSDVAGQMERVTQTKYDVVLIQIGGNDVTHFTSLTSLENDLRVAVSSAKEKSDRIILISSGKVGDAPFIPRFLAPLFNHRYMEVRDVFMRLATTMGITYVDLLPVSDTFGTDADKYYAVDYFHPSSEGYALWYGVLKEVVQETWPEIVHEK
jgi:lysophospholipase L1-like esterase